MFVPNQWVFVFKPPLISSSNTEVEMVRASYNKLQLQKAGLFQIIEVHPHTAVIGENEVPNTVWTHRVRAAPRVKNIL